MIALLYLTHAGAESSEIVSLGARIGYWVISNMADINVLFKRKPLTIEINRFLTKNKLEYFAQTNSTATHRDVSEFYTEISKAVAILEEKYTSEPPAKRQCIQKFVGTRDMVVNTLRKIHLKICRRLRSSPSLATPWRADFTMDIPKEVFSVIFEEIIKHNGYGHESKETTSLIEVSVNEKKKAIFIFNHINVKEDIIGKEELLQKKFKCKGENALERCEIIVNKLTPLRFKYSKSTEVLSVHFSYGYWNKYGVQQH